MLIDMIHDNHGEPPFKTRFRDPALLRRYGYQAIVIPDALAALPSAYFDPAAQPPSPTAPNARKPAELEAAIDLRVREALAANLQVFFYGDALLLPRSIIQKRPEAYLCDDHSGGTGRLCPGKPAVFEALGDLVGELFDRWPQAAGLVMRTGEVYPEATPHMIGSPLHATTCPSCRHLSLIDRLIQFIQLMHDVVIVDLGRTYIHRAWQPTVAGLPNMHDDPTVYRTIADRLPRSDRLCISFKFTRGDFRARPGGAGANIFNPCLTADNRPKWIELQCEREFEGKGAFPNYQAPLWKQFLQHLNPTPPTPRDPDNAALHDSPAPQPHHPDTSPSTLPSHFSLWGWSRGGGWGGPYIQREEWLDANVYALAQLYQNPSANPQDIATAWTSLTFAVPESAPPSPAIAELLAISPTAIRKLLYCAALHDDTIAPWVRDDLLDVNALWAAALRIVELDAADAACLEKAEALQVVDRIRRVWEIAQPDLPNKSQVRDLTGSLLYFDSFAGAVAHCFCGFVRFLQWSRTGRADAALARQAADHLDAAQEQWHLHTQRHALLPGAPSVFHENTFWQRTNDCREQLQAATP